MGWKMQKSKNTSKKLKSSLSKITTKCEFCKKDFINQDSLVKHSCAKKKRWLVRDNKINQIGFNAFTQFFKISFPKQKDKTYRDFIDSRYYTTFINFASHAILLDGIDLSQYIKFLIKREYKIDDWDKAHVYQTYIKEKVLIESIDDAFVRSLKILKVCEDNIDIKIKDFFKEIDTDYGKVLLKSGKISPWMLFIMDGENLLSRFNEYDMNEIDFLLNVETWNKKMLINKKRVKELKDILKENYG